MSMLYSVKFVATLRQSDTYPDQFCTEKSKFTALVSFTESGEQEGWRV